MLSDLGSMPMNVLCGIGSSLRTKLRARLEGSTARSRQIRWGHHAEGSAAFYAFLLVTVLLRRDFRRRQGLPLLSQLERLSVDWQYIPRSTDGPLEQY